MNPALIPAFVRITAAAESVSTCSGFSTRPATQNAIAPESAAQIVAGWSNRASVAVYAVRVNAEVGEHLGEDVGAFRHTAIPG